MKNKKSESYCDEDGLSELDTTRIHNLADLNARLWAWLELVYHQRVHSALDGLTPLARYQQDLPRIRALGSKAANLDEIFYHRVSRKVRRDGTVSWLNKQFEVPYELAGKQIHLVIDPYTKTAIRVEDDEGKDIGAVTPLDVIANCHRSRRKPEAIEASTPGMETTMIEDALKRYGKPVSKGDQ